MASNTRLATTIAARYTPTVGAIDAFYLDGRISGKREELFADLTLDRTDRGAFIAVYASTHGSKTPADGNDGNRAILDAIANDLKKNHRHNIDYEINELAESAVNVAGRLTLSDKGVSPPYFSGIIVKDGEMAAVTLGRGCAYLYRDEAIFALTEDDYPLEPIDTAGRQINNMNDFAAGIAGSIRYSNIAQLKPDDCLIVCNREVMEAVGQKGMLRLLDEAEDQSDAAGMIMSEAVRLIPNVSMQIVISFVEEIEPLDRVGRNTLSKGINVRDTLGKGFAAQTGPVKINKAQRTTGALSAAERSQIAAAAAGMGAAAGWASEVAKPHETTADEPTREDAISAADEPMRADTVPTVDESAWKVDPFEADEKIDESELDELDLPDSEPAEIEPEEVAGAAEVSVSAAAAKYFTEDRVGDSELPDTEHSEPIPTETLEEAPTVVAEDMTSDQVTPAIEEGVTDAVETELQRPLGFGAAFDLLNQKKQSADAQDEAIPSTDETMKYAFQVQPVESDGESLAQEVADDERPDLIDTDDDDEIYADPDDSDGWSDDETDGWTDDDLAYDFDDKEEDVVQDELPMTYADFDLEDDYEETPDGVEPKDKSRGKLIAVIVLIVIAGVLLGFIIYSLATGGATDSITTPTTISPLTNQSTLITGSTTTAEPGSIVSEITTTEEETTTTTEEETTTTTTEAPTTTTTEAPTTTTTEAPTTAAEQRTYTIVSGDSVYAIARKFYPDSDVEAKMLEIAAANGHSYSKAEDTINWVLSPGDVIVVP